MQPYFLPYVGYYQLLAAVDAFVIYDNLKYTKKGWINRNRIVVDGMIKTITLPVASGADTLQIGQRRIAPTFLPRKLLNQVEAAYSRAPYRHETLALLEEIVDNPTTNLFDFLHASIVAVAAHLGITTPIFAASTIPIDHELKAQDKVIALCTSMSAETYINAIGGTGLYSRDTFREHGIELKFLQTELCEYSQGNSTFIPGMSIIDVLMHNSVETVRERMLNSYGFC